MLSYPHFLGTPFFCKLGVPLTRLIQKHFWIPSLRRFYNFIKPKKQKTSKIWNFKVFETPDFVGGTPLFCKIGVPLTSRWQSKCWIPSLRLRLHLLIFDKKLEFWVYDFWFRGGGGSMILGCNYYQISCTIICRMLSSRRCLY